MNADTTDSGGTMRRRTFLKGAAGAATLAVAGTGASASAAAQSGFDGWFDGVSNYDGVVDKTGNSEVTVEVGAKGNNGAFAFGPAAVRVDPGTTVVWEWTGEGGSHNVAAESGDFESEMVGEAGHTFEHTFEDEGTFKYACTPHKPMGMKGAVVVGDAEVGSPSGSGSASDESGAESGESNSESDSSNSASASDSAERSLGDYLTLGFGGALIVGLLGLPLAEARQRERK